MLNKGEISITINFDNPVQSDDAATYAVMETLLNWAKDEIYAMRTSKGAKIPFEFNDEDSKSEW